MEKKRGHVFKGWNEGKIYFPPTYKYSENSDRYSGMTCIPRRNVSLLHGKFPLYIVNDKTEEVGRNTTEPNSVTKPISTQRSSVSVPAQQDKNEVKKAQKNCTEKTEEIKLSNRFQALDQTLPSGC